MTVQEYSDFMLKHIFIYLIISIGIITLTLFGDMLFNQHIENAIFALLLSAIETILIIVYLSMFYREHLDGDLKRELDYFKNFLNKRTVRYERVVVAHESFQFKLKRDLDKLLLKELMFSLERYMEVKETDYGTWLIVYKIGYGPEKECKFSQHSQQNR